MLSFIIVSCIIFGLLVLFVSLLSVDSSHNNYNGNGSGDRSYNYSERNMADIMRRQAEATEELARLKQMEAMNSEYWNKK